MSFPSSHCCADAFLGLCRAAPRRPSNQELPESLALACLQIRAAALLSMVNPVSGLGDGQRHTVATAIKTAVAGVTRALQTPRTHLTLSQIVLLRRLARGSGAREREAAFATRGHCLPHEFRTHRHAPYTVIKDFADGLVLAELGYDVLLEGAKSLCALATPPFFEALDEGLELVSMCNVAWMMPILFDGLRLRCGLNSAAACAAAAVPTNDDSETTDASDSGLGEGDAVATRLLSDGERVVDCERIRVAALFFLATSREALGQLNDLDEDVLAYWRTLEADLRLGLERCREESEKRGHQPGRAMRVVLDAFADLLEMGLSSANVRSLMRLAFAFPCLVPSRLHPLAGYDGGLLSVWDACLHLLQLHATLHQEVLPLHTLACSVLGGVVGNLLAPTELGGPFVVHSASDVMARIDRIQAAWPPRHTAKAQVVASGSGKMVGANAVLTEALATGHFRAQNGATRQSEARFDAALTMRVLCEGLAADGVHTTDGIAPLRRIYIAALHFEPSMPEGPIIERAHYSAIEASPLALTAAGQLPCAVPAELIDTVWRDVIGAALLLSGPLFCFTRRALADALEDEWSPTDAMQQALRDRMVGTSKRGAPVMSPSVAVCSVVQRAHAHARMTVEAVDAVVLSTDGPRVVTRAVEYLGVWSRTAFSPGSASGTLWEALVVGLCPSIKKKHR